MAKTKNALKPFATIPLAAGSTAYVAWKIRRSRQTSAADPSRKETTAKAIWSPSTLNERNRSNALQKTKGAAPRASHLTGANATRNVTIPDGVAFPNPTGPLTISGRSDKQRIKAKNP